MWFISPCLSTSAIFIPFTYEIHFTTIFFFFFYCMCKCRTLDIYLCHKLNKKFSKISFFNVRIYYIRKGGAPHRTKRLEALVTKFRSGKGTRYAEAYGDLHRTMKMLDFNQSSIEQKEHERKGLPQSCNSIQHHFNVATFHYWY